MWNHQVVIEKNPETGELEARCTSCNSVRTQKSIQTMNSFGYILLFLASIIGIFWTVVSFSNNGNIPEYLHGGPQVASAFGGLLLLVVGLFNAAFDLTSFKEAHEAGPR